MRRWTPLVSVVSALVASALITSTLSASASVVAAAAASGADAQRTSRHPADAVLDVLVFGDVSRQGDVTALAPDVRSAYEAYVRRDARFRSRLPPQGGPASTARMLRPVFERYERMLTAASADRQAQTRAVAYVMALRPCYEWEGYHACPEREATFADRYLSDHPDDPLRAFLPLLAAHRWLCAAEAFAYEGNATGTAQATRNFEQRLGIATQAVDPLLRAAAASLAARRHCFAEDRDTR